MNARARVGRNRWFGLLALGGGLIVLGIATNPVFIALGGLAGFVAVIMLGKSSPDRQ